MTVSDIQRGISNRKQVLKKQLKKVSIAKARVLFIGSGRIDRMKKNK